MGVFSYFKSRLHRGKVSKEQESEQKRRLTPPIIVITEATPRSSLEEEPDRTDYSPPLEDPENLHPRRPQRRASLAPSISGLTPPNAVHIYEPVRGHHRTYTPIKVRHNSITVPGTREAQLIKDTYALDERGKIRQWPALHNANPIAQDQAAAAQQQQTAPRITSYRQTSTLGDDTLRRPSPIITPSLHRQPSSGLFGPAPRRRDIRSQRAPISSRLIRARERVHTPPLQTIFFQRPPSHRRAEIPDAIFGVRGQDGFPSSSRREDRAPVASSPIVTMSESEMPTQSRRLRRARPLEPGLW